MARLLLFGPGYTGKRIAAALTAREWDVRTVGRADAPDLSWPTHIVSTVPPAGEIDPILGLYSSHFGGKAPTIALVGQGQATPGKALRSELTFIVSHPEPALPDWRGAAAEGVCQGVRIG